jgi:hypothetical protein
LWLADEDFTMKNLIEGKTDSGRSGETENENGLSNHSTDGKSSWHPLGSGGAPTLEQNKNMSGVGERETTLQQKRIGTGISRAGNCLLRSSEEMSNSMDELPLSSLKSLSKYSRYQFLISSSLVMSRSVSSLMHLTWMMPLVFISLLLAIL